MSEKYGKEYFDGGENSNYGGDNPDYTRENYLPIKRKVANKIISLIGLPKTYMCLGAGRGYLMLAFKYLGVDVSGIDISEYAVNTCPDDIKDKLVQGDISDTMTMMNYGVSSYDFVSLFDVAEHIKQPELDTAILHAIRITKDYIAVNVPVKNIDDEPDESETSTDKTHVSIYSPTYWINRFMNIGMPFGLELRTVEVVHNEHTYQMFALFQKVPQVNI